MAVVVTEVHAVLGLLSAFRIPDTGVSTGTHWDGMASRPLRQVAVVGSLLLLPVRVRPSGPWLLLYLWGWVAWYTGPLGP